MNRADPDPTLDKLPTSFAAARDAEFTDTDARTAVGVVRAREAGRLDPLPAPRPSRIGRPLRLATGLAGAGALAAVVALITIGIARAPSTAEEPAGGAAAPPASSPTAATPSTTVRPDEALNAALARPATAADAFPGAVGRGARDSRLVAVSPHAALYALAGQGRFGQGPAELIGEDQHGPIYFYGGDDARGRVEQRCLVVAVPGRTEALSCGPTSDLVVSERPVPRLTDSGVAAASQVLGVTASAVGVSLGADYTAASVDGTPLVITNGTALVDRANVDRTIVATGKGKVDQRILVPALAPATQPDLSSQANPVKVMLGPGYTAATVDGVPLTVTKGGVTVDRAKVDRTIVMTGPGRAEQRIPVPAYQVPATTDLQPQGSLDPTEPTGPLAAIDLIGRPVDEVVARLQAVGLVGVGGPNAGCPGMASSMPAGAPVTGVQVLDDGAVQLAAGEPAASDCSAGEPDSSMPSAQDALAAAIARPATAADMPDSAKGNAAAPRLRLVALSPRGALYATAGRPGEFCLYVVVDTRYDSETCGGTSTTLASVPIDGVRAADAVAVALGRKYTSATVDGLPVAITNGTVLVDRTTAERTIVLSGPGVAEQRIAVPAWGTVAGPDFPKRLELPADPPPVASLRPPLAALGLVGESVDVGLTNLHNIGLAGVAGPIIRCPGAAASTATDGPVTNARVLDDGTVQLSTGETSIGDCAAGGFESTSPALKPLAALSDDTLPKGVEFPKQFADQVAKKDGAHLDEARLVLRRGGEQFWLIPSRDGMVCEARLVPGPAGFDIGYGCGATPTPGGYSALGMMNGQNIEAVATGVVGDDVVKVVNGGKKFPVEHNFFAIPTAELSGGDLVLVSRDGSTQTIKR